MVRRGIYTMVVGSMLGQDTMVESVIEKAVHQGYVVKGDSVVVTSGNSGGVGKAYNHLLKIIDRKSVV